MANPDRTSNRRQNTKEERGQSKQDDMRRSSERNDNPKSFDDDYEVSREDEITREEAKSEKENRGGR